MKAAPFPSHLRPVLGATLTLLVLAGLPGCATIVSATREGPIEDPASGRSFGRSIDDEVLETKIRVNIDKAHEDLDRAHVVAEVYNGIVLLAGQVPRDELVRVAEDALAPLRGVRSVHNYLKVAGPTSVLARSNDALISGRVNTALLFAEDVDSGLFEVVTEDSVVYLLGVVSRAHAERAVDVVSRVGGVRKIVKVIEYTD